MRVNSKTSSQFPVPSSQFPVPSSQFPVPSNKSQVPNPKFYPVVSSRRDRWYGWSAHGGPRSVVRRRPPAYGASAVVRDCDRNRRGCGVQSDGERSLRFLVSNAKPQVLRSKLQEPKGNGVFGKSWTPQCVLHPKSQERKNDRCYQK